MTTIDDLEAEFNSLEHEWFVQQNFERPPTKEMMEQVMKLCRDALNLVDDVPVACDFKEMRKELKHRINVVIDEEVL